MPITPGYSVFADESSFGDRYMGFGAILLPTKHVAAVEAALEAYCTKRGFRGREMSWKKCTASKADRYLEFGSMFWELAETLPRIDFHGMILDRSQYPLKAPEWGCHTEEDGFYKFYHSFLTRSVARVASKDPPYQLHIAMTTDWYPHRDEILQKTVGGTLGRSMGRGYQIVGITRDKPKSYRVHQLADVLIGAVMFRLNARDPESHKEAIVAGYEAEHGKSLDYDCKPYERPFNLWFFTRTRDTRWARGSRGRA